MCVCIYIYMCVSVCLCVVCVCVCSVCVSVCGVCVSVLFPLNKFGCSNCAYPCLITHRQEVCQGVCLPQVG
jgi:uncharacterized membrane protein